MAKGAITKRTVDAARPAAKDHFIWDDGRDATPGFGLKVTPTGGKTYIFQYRIARPGVAERTPPKRYTIGRHGQLTPVQARRRASELAAMVAIGVDPLASEQAQRDDQDRLAREAVEQAKLDGELAFDRYARVWLEHYEHEKNRRPSSVRQAKLIVDRHLKPVLKSKPMPHISRADLQPILDAMPVKQKGMRRAVFAYGSVIFGWASRRGDIPANPFKAMEKPEAPKARDRVLSDDELAAIWRASETLNSTFGAFFRLLILTGQRRSEVAGIGWGELDRATATWTIAASRAKNGVAHVVALCERAVAELDALAAIVLKDEKERDKKNWPKSGFVLTTTSKTPISGITKAKLALDTAAAKAHGDNPLAAWRIHDLRRTLATGLQRLGIRFEVTEAVLNHVSGAKGGVAGIYQRHDWKEEKRSALDAWAGHVAAILKPAEAKNIVAITAAKRSA